MIWISRALYWGRNATSSWKFFFLSISFGL